MYYYDIYISLPSDNIFVFYDKDGTVVQSNNDNYVDISPLEVSNNGDTYTCTLKLNDRESDPSNILEIKVLGKCVCVWVFFCQ